VTERFAKVPAELISDTRVTPAGVRVFACLHRYGTTPDKCYPSVKEVAKGSAMSRAAATRALTSLEAAGWITRHPRKARGLQTSSGYALYPSPRSHGGSDTSQRWLTSEPAGGSSASHKGGSPASHEREPLNESHLTKTPLPPAADAPVVALHGGRGGMPATFDDFWLAYPRKQSRGPARHAWVQATRRASPDEIVAGAQRYAADPNLVVRYAPAPARWLEEERWADGPLPDRNPNESLARLNQMADAIDAGADFFTWTPEQPSISSGSSPRTGAASSLPRRSSSGS
jgi:hypothetical protein